MASRPTQDSLLQWLEEAYSSPYGIYLQSNNADDLRRELYKARRNHPHLKIGLMLRISPDDPDRLWIVRRSPEEEQSIAQRADAEDHHQDL
jgi:hypothetical protein